MDSASRVGMHISSNTRSGSRPATEIASAPDRISRTSANSASIPSLGGCVPSSFSATTLAPVAIKPFYSWSPFSVKTLSRHSFGDFPLPVPVSDSGVVNALIRRRRKVSQELGPEPQIQIGQVQNQAKLSDWMFNWKRPPCPSAFSLRNEDVGGQDS